MLVASASLATTVGCSIGNHEKWKFASLDVRKAAFWKHDDKPEPETPARLVTTWSEAVLNRAGEPSKRGFGGRLVFFKNDSQDPIRVDGQLVVYAFDETAREPYRTEPTKRYVYPAEDLSHFESESALGTSYSIWLPWDEAGGTERKISLIARFEPKDGPAIVGEQTKHYLAGPPANPTPADGGQQMALAPIPMTDNATSAASYQTAAAPQVPAGQASLLAADATRLDTATFALPRKLSPTPGAPLRGPRAADSARVFTTPQMEPVMPTSGAQAQFNATARNVPPHLQQQPLEQSYAEQAIWQSPTTTGGQSGWPGRSPAQPPSAGYQSAQPLAPATPRGQ